MENSFLQMIYVFYSPKLLTINCQICPHMYSDLGAWSQNTNDLKSWILYHKQYNKSFLNSFIILVYAAVLHVFW